MAGCEGGAETSTDHTTVTSISVTEEQAVRQDFGKLSLLDVEQLFLSAEVHG